MSDSIDNIIDSLKSEQDMALQRKIQALKLKEAEVLLAEKDAALSERLANARHTKMASYSKTQLVGKLAKGIGAGAWKIGKAIHVENQKVRQMEARAIATRRARRTMQEDMQ